MCDSLYEFRDLLVHLELRIAILEEGVDLLGSSDTGVDVCLGSLSTHLLRCREVTALELSELVVGPDERMLRATSRKSHSPELILAFTVSSVLNASSTSMPYCF